MRLIQLIKSLLKPRPKPACGNCAHRLDWADPKKVICHQWNTDGQAIEILKTGWCGTYKYDGFSGGFYTRPKNNLKLLKRGGKGFDGV